MRKPDAGVAIIALGAAAAAVGTWISTWHGAGLSPDSVVYVASARHFLAGRGFTTPTAAGIDLPLTQFPPGFPFLLACIVRWLRLDLFFAARGLNIAMFGATVGLAGAWTWRRTRQSGLTALAMMVCLFSVDLIRVSSMVWSETSFLFFTLLSLFILDAYLAAPTRLKLVCSALVVSAAWMTRYSGISVAVAGVLILVFGQSKTLKQRLGDGVLFGMVAGVPMAIWLIRNVTLTHHATTRVWVFHPLLSEIAEAVKSSISLWMFQQRYPGTAITTAGLGFLALFLVLWWRSRANSSATAKGGILAVFSFCYVLLIVLTVFFLEAGLLVPDEYDRILCPLHLTLLLLVVSVISRWRWSGPAQWGFAGAGAAVAIYFSFTGLKEIQVVSQDGQQYASQAWRESPTMGFIKRFKPIMHIYTNGTKPVYLYTERACYEIPPKVMASSLQPNPDYPRVMARIQDEVKRKIAVVVYFPHEYHSEFPSADELRGLFGPPSATPPDGLIFGG